MEEGHTPSYGTVVVVSIVYTASDSSKQSYTSSAILELAHQLGGSGVLGRSLLDSLVVAHCKYRSMSDG